MGRGAVEEEEDEEEEEGEEEAAAASRWAFLRFFLFLPGIVEAAGTRAWGRRRQ